MMRKKKSTPNMDYLLLTTVAFLSIIGLMMIFNTTYYLGLELHDQPAYFLLKQVFFVALGIGGMVFMMFVDYDWWRKYATPIIAITVLVLFVVLVIGSTRFGGQRWLSEGSYQPSEMAKLTTIIYLAAWLASKKEKIADVTLGLLPFTILLGFIVGLILLQGDLSTPLLIAITAFVMFFVAGGSVMQIILSAAGGALVVALMIMQSSYRMARVAGFLNPFDDTLGQNYQIQQILIGIGSGGFSGLGWGAGRQKFGAIPAAHTDAIFAILGEELGFIGAMVVIALFAFLAYRGFKISLNATESEFGTLLAVGLTVSLILQAIINIGVVTATIPFTGIPLPFISYGGSSIVVTLMSVGLLLAISRGSKKSQEPRGRKETYETDDLGRRNWGTRVPSPRRRPST